MHNSLIGVGLRHPHLCQFVDELPNIGWVEIHSENYYSLGGPDFDYLLEVRKNYPVSLHGIGMSLGSKEGIDDNHLAQVKDLIDIIDPFLVSDHMSWNTISDKFLPDLMPTPFNEESLEVFVKNIAKVQECFSRELLIENPSTYFEFTNSTMSEPEFLNILAKKTGAKIIVDINNIYVSSKNNGWSANEYINNLDCSIVKEIHLAGHMVKELPDNKTLYIDSHNDYVCEEVWELYAFALHRFGKTFTLLEWDSDIPDLMTLINEAKKAEKYLNIIPEQNYA